MEIHQRTKTGKNPFSQVEYTLVGSMIALLSQDAVSSLTKHCGCDHTQEAQDNQGLPLKALPRDH